MSEWKGAKPAYRVVETGPDGPWLYSWDKPPLPSPRKWWTESVRHGNEAMVAEMAKETTE